MTTTAEGPDGVDAVIADLDDWRGQRLQTLRDLIHDAAPDVVEEIKWRKKTNPLGVPTWSSDGILCTGESYKDKIKLTFMHGGEVDDPSGLFNSGTGVRRAIDITESDEIDPAAFTQLVRSAATRNAQA